MQVRSDGTRIEWIQQNCQLLSSLFREYERTLPFRGKRIGTCIHLEPKTAALLMTLKSGGAEIIASGNLNSTQPETVSHLRKHGIEVHAKQTTDPEQHTASLRRVLEARPDLLLDNGGDLFTLFLDEPYDGRLLGGTEETTSGRNRLLPMRNRLDMPIFVINDSPIKQFAENRHAVGQSVFESFMRLTNCSTNGKRVTVMGYGPCGEGVAGAFRNAFSVVCVTDPDPVKLLAAHLDGFLTPHRDEALGTADIIVTVTGAKDVLTVRDLPLLSNGVTLINAGHFPVEIDVTGLRSSATVVGTCTYGSEAIESLTLVDGRCIHILAGGHTMSFT